MTSPVRGTASRLVARLSVLGAVSAAVALGPLLVAQAVSMTVTSITSSATPATNAAGSRPTLTVKGSDIPQGASLRLTPTFQASDPNAIPLTTITAPASTVTNDGTTWTWTGTANLAHAAAGNYTVELVSGQASAACTCTFSVGSAGSPSPGPQVRPATIAQGVTGTLKIPDDAAAAGAVVSFGKDSGVSVNAPARFGTSTECGTGQCILAPVKVATDAKTGVPIDVIVTNSPASSTDTANVGKCAGCLSLSAAPTLDSLSPPTLGQGASTTLTINGGNFADKATVTFGDGVTATDKPTVTASKITVPVSVAPTAPATVTVTVTNPDLGSASKDLATDAGPTIANASPQFVGAAFTGTLTLTGTNYHAGATVSFPADSGVATSGSPTVSADGTTLTVPVKVQRTTPAAVDVTVANPDDKGSAVCTGCLGVAVAPADVTNLAATRNDTAVTVAWSAVQGTDTGGAPITGYTVSVLQPANSGVKPQTVTDTSASFTGLSATLNYTFKVVAVNAANLKSPGVIGSTGGQEGGTALALTGRPSSLVAGQRVTLSGSLATAAGDPIAGASILVSARDAAGQTSVVGTATTSPDGSWSLPAAPKRSVTFVASFAGDDQNTTATSDPLRITVAPKVTIAAPHTSSSAHPLVVVGTVSPTMAGKAVHMIATGSKGVKKDFGTTTLSGSSSYKFKVKLAKGTWTLVVRIGSTSGNIAGHSKTLKVERT